MNWLDYILGWVSCLFFTALLWVFVELGLRARVVELIETLRRMFL